MKIKELKQQVSNCLLLLCQLRNYPSSNKGFSAHKGIFHLFEKTLSFLVLIGFHC